MSTSATTNPRSLFKSDGDGARPGAARSGKAAVRRPPYRWTTRLLLPAALLLGAGGLLAYSLRDAFLPAVEVQVLPVVARPLGAGERTAGSDQPLADRGANATASVVAQAPGWIEPAPYPIIVQSLIEGVVEEVLVLEGHRVEAGQVVARLVDDDALLAVRRAEADLAERGAEIARAKAAIIVAEARTAELQDEVDRKRDLASTGGISEGEYARLVHRLNAIKSEVETARAEASVAEAAQLRAQVALDEAKLMLERTVIRSPIDGVVLSRSVEPGSRIMVAGFGGGSAEGESGGLLRVYDPSKLQVRADVPLADIGKVAVGMPVEVTTEAAPDQVFAGVVDRIVHKADIQRNTVEVKVTLIDPPPLLKPEMLGRVRLLAVMNESERAGGSGGGGAEGGMGVAFRLMAPRAGIVDRTGEEAAVWVAAAGSRSGHVAQRRQVTLGRAELGEYVAVIDGVQAGDRIIINPPPTLSEGDRIRPVEAASNTQQTKGGE